MVLKVLEDRRTVISLTGVLVSIVVLKVSG